MTKLQMMEENQQRQLETTQEGLRNLKTTFGGSECPPQMGLTCGTLKGKYSK